jgi:hypothetical protein
LWPAWGYGGDFLPPPPVQGAYEANLLLRLAHRMRPRHT